MTVRISQIRSTAAIALSALLALSLTASAQLKSPRYQSPGTLPPEPQSTTLPSTPAITPDGVVVEDVVVRVNDQIISRSDVERQQQQLQQELRQGGPQAGDPEERQKNMLRDLIDQQLLLSRGKELGITGDTELIRRLDDIRKQNHLDSMEDFKAQIRNSIITSSVLRDEVSRHLQMSQSEERKYYEAHKDQFAQPEQA